MTTFFLVLMWACFVISFGATVYSILSMDQYFGTDDPTLLLVFATITSTFGLIILGVISSQDIMHALVPPEWVRYGVMLIFSTILLTDMLWIVQNNAKDFEGGDSMTESERFKRWFNFYPAGKIPEKSGKKRHSYRLHFSQKRAKKKHNTVSSAQ